MKLFLVPRSPCEKLLSDKTKISDSDGQKWKRKTEPFLQRPWKLLENCCVQLDPRTTVVAALPCKLAISTGNFHHSGFMNLRALFRAFACKRGELLRDERGRNHKRWRRHDVLNPAIALGELEDARPRMTLSFRARIWSSHFEHGLYQVISSSRWFKCKKDVGSLKNKITCFPYW